MWRPLTVHPSSPYTRANQVVPRALRISAGDCDLIAARVAVVFGALLAGSRTAARGPLCDIRRANMLAWKRSLGLTDMGSAKGKGPDARLLAEPESSRVHGRLQPPAWDWRVPDAASTIGGDTPYLDANTADNAGRLTLITASAMTSCMGPLKINLSHAFAGQRVGVKQVEEKIWLVSFMRYDLGFFDHETCRIESAENPFAAKVLAVSGINLTYLFGIDKKFSGSGGVLPIDLPDVRLMRRRR